MRLTSRLLAMAALGCLLPTSAGAALGGGAASVEQDRAKLNGALRVSRAERFAVHELTLPTGTRVREYVSPSDVVFALVWAGPWMPELESLLGAHYAAYAQAVREAPRRRGPRVVRLPDLVVELGGHPRAFFGRAYLPGAVPAGVRAEALP